MNNFKKAALIALGTVATGFMIFSAATIGLVVLGAAMALTVVGFLAKPFLPKGPRKPVIIDVTPTSSTIS